MKYLCLVDQLQVQLLKGKLRIRPRLSGEAEGPVSSGVKGNKGQGREHRAVLPDPLCLDPGLLKGIYEQPAKGVRSHLAQKCRPEPVFT